MFFRVSVIEIRPNHMPTVFRVISIVIDEFLNHSILFQVIFVENSCKRFKYTTSAKMLLPPEGEREMTDH